MKRHTKEQHCHQTHMFLSYTAKEEIMQENSSLSYDDFSESEDDLHPFKNASYRKQEIAAKKQTTHALSSKVKSSERSPRSSKRSARKKEFMSNSSFDKDSP